MYSIVIRSWVRRIVLIVHQLRESPAVFSLCSIKRKFNSFYEVVGLATALAISGYLAAGMFNDSAVSVAPYFWFFMGLGIAVNRIIEKQ